MTNDNDNVARAWELMRKIGFAMLVTRDGDKLRARPMSAYLERDENAIYFLTDARRHKDEEIARNPSINLSFADAGSMKYVSLTGTAVVSNDRARIKELFSTPAKAWWDSADDPNIRVLKVTPDDAEFWDSPGSVIAYVKMAVAAATGTRPEIGDNRKVAMQMPIEPPEIPPPTPGQPTEPPREEPPGNPNPEIPPPVHEPGAPPQPQELPGKMPDEVPGHGPTSPATPNPATDRAGDNQNLTL